MKFAFAKAGLRISRIAKASNINSPPEVVSSPIAASYREGNRFLLEPAAVQIEVSKVVNPQGFSFSTDLGSWNPFVQCLMEGDNGYEHSILKKYYTAFNPKNAQEALIANFQKPFSLAAAPYYASRFLIPWSTVSIDKATRSVESIAKNENREHANSSTGIEGGDLLLGPVSEEKGRIEYKRYHLIYQSIKTNGYQRNGSNDGDIKVYVLERDGDYRYLVNSGAHRMTAVSACGLKEVPARLLCAKIIKEEEVIFWPQVQMGLWDEENALIYFNHLFDFDACDWAKKCNII